MSNLDVRLKKLEGQREAEYRALVSELADLMLAAGDAFMETIKRIEDGNASPEDKETEAAFFANLPVDFVARGERFYTRWGKWGK